MSLEQQAQVNSVLRIIRESIGMLKISLIVPNIFKNPTILRQYLNTAEYEYCIKLLDEYIKEKVDFLFY